MPCWRRDSTSGFFGGGGADKGFDVKCVCGEDGFEDR